ncbi:hypothetical protein [Chryseobacterium sp. Bi04]|uniref:AbiTii domain-containing protein n=1 Tax=Chryseobacterium sp. Bi04 TaxID=2822345 RepID=UPI001DA7F59B|nr:hypothetical protein [Chryseobacterium sp. Bi04]CAH0255794.1 hypothetical protein SRABI04_03351 [Chryseobacterium sp. Bi04]
MIKDLIEDLTFDKITLSQALTRAKIISYKINNSDFKDWLQSEINGYKNVPLPEYRNISCEVFAEISDLMRGGTRTIPMDVSNLENTLGTEYSFYNMRMTQSIGTLEMGLEKDKGKGSSYGYIYFPSEFAKTLASMSPDGQFITAVKRRVHLSEIDYILEQTKQKLLDTLLELNNTFPDLENTFSNQNKVDDQKVQTIVNHNIYGNYANSNIGVGDNIKQDINVNNNIQELVKELERIGVEKEDITEVAKIINTETKENVSKKIFSWVGKIATKAVEKGIDLQVPLLIETVSKYM